MITLAHKDLVRHLENEAFYSHVLTMNLEGKAEKVILRDLQRHPVKPVVLHADFLRVDNKTRLHMNVPLHFINEDTSIGVKQQGGLVAHLASDVEVSCLAQDLPEYIEVDLAELQVGESIHLSQIKVPEGVELLALSQGAGHDLAIVSINMPRGVAEEEQPTETAEPEGDTGESAE
jgi:large subunit ribosomal protein L25